MILIKGLKKFEISNREFGYYNLKGFLILSSMMHCDRCNIDFSEGLRYCKWCGQTLTERKRITSELHSCPSCTAPVQPSWAFCKACGTKLTAPASEPIGAVCPHCGAMTDPRSLNCLRCGEDLTRGRTAERPATDPMAGTSLIAYCASCSEPLDSSSMYCKACGAAVYEQAGPFGASSLLCHQCNSHSPVGSTECRVCGARLAAVEPVAEEEAIGQEKKSSTLPDLADHLPDKEQGERPTRTDDIGSSPARDGKEVHDQTILVGAPPLPRAKDSEPLSSAGASKTDERKTDERPRQSRPHTTAETSVLPGVAGSKSEMPSPTAIIEQRRTTGAVEATDQIIDEGQLVEEEQIVEEAVPEVEVEPLIVEVEKQVPPRAVDLPRESLKTVSEMPAMSRPEARAIDDAERTLHFVSASDIEEDETRQIDETGETLAFGSRPETPPVIQLEAPALPEIKETETIRGEIHTAPFGLEPSLQPQSDTVELKQEAESRVEAEAARTRAVNLAGHVKSEQAAQTALTPAQGEQASAEVAAQPLPHEKKGAPIVSIAVVVLIVGLALAALWWYVSGGPRRESTSSPPAVATEQPATTPEPPVAPEPPPAKPAPPAQPEGMVMVAGGTYVIGRKDGDKFERPAHTIDLPAFFIDRTEVTRAAYKAFLDATGHRPPKTWKGGAYAEGEDDFPVTDVTWQDAADYAAWAGKRLPREEEWEAAARGAQGLLYPWGSDWQAGIANIGLKGGKINPVGQFPQSASTVGALDMIGNVWEWTADEFQLYPGSTESMPRFEGGITYRIIRGGAFDGDRRHNASYRGLQDASKPYPKVGFRCVKDAK